MYIKGDAINSPHAEYHMFIADLISALEIQRIEEGIMDKYKLHSHGDNWFHFRKDLDSMMESFSITYCHDGDQGNGEDII